MTRDDLYIPCLAPTVHSAASNINSLFSENVFDVVLDASTETVATADGSLGTPTAAAFVAFAFMEAAIQNGGLCGVCVCARGA